MGGGRKRHGGTKAHQQRTADDPSVSVPVESNQPPRPPKASANHAPRPVDTAPAAKPPTKPANVTPEEPLKPVKTLAKPDKLQSEVTSGAESLAEKVSQLKITKEAIAQTLPMKASNNIPSNVNANEKRAQEAEPEKSHADVVAERKAKAAEAKARKAAAAAAKKLQKESGEPGGGGAAGKKPNQEKPKQNSQVKPSLSQGRTGNDSAATNGADVKKTAISSGASRAAQPFRRVHFDMTPASDAEHVPVRQPSLTDISPVNVHPAFLDFAAKCEAKEIIGIDAVCVAFIKAFTEFLSSYSMSEQRKMSHDLDQSIRPHLGYLTENGSQPFPLALGNLIRQLKKEINQLPDSISETEGKRKLIQWLEDFITQNFDLALQAISSFCISKMENAPYIITYSWCPIVERIILDAYNRKLAFHVCILDSPIEGRGRRLARTLCARNIECTYGSLGAAGYVMKQCRMVLLGCSAILSNGYVVADRGSSQVALIAAAANVPVLVAAQTFKFVDRVQTFDSGLRAVSALVGERKEAIPADLITAVVTELRIVPPSSAPAVLKAKQLAIG